MPKKLIVNIVTPSISTPVAIPVVSVATTGDFNIVINGKRIEITPKETLPYNCEVGIEISSGLPAQDGTVLADDIDYFYTTHYNPYYSTPTMVRLTEGIGIWIKDVPNDTIWRTILKNSMYAVNKWDNGNDRLVISGTNIPYCLPEFVTYATVLDLMSYIMFYLISNAGSKRLADLSITNNGPSSFQGPFSEFRQHVVKKFEELERLVKIKCTPPGPRQGIRSIDFWEPQPIIQYDRTWKRYPKVDRINSAWSKMYRHSQYNVNLTNIDNAYDRGVLVVPKSKSGDFTSWTPQ